MNFSSILDWLNIHKFTEIGIVLVVSLLFFFVFKKVINFRLNRVKNLEKNMRRKRKTYLKLTVDIIKYLIIIIDGMIILQIFGINVSSIIAGLGIVSVITGLALQDALKDIIAGFNIILDSYFSVGDVIEIDDVQGKVVDIEIKTTKLKDINNGNILVIANRNIVRALTLSEQFDIEFPLPYNESIENMENIINKIVENVRDEKKVKDIKYIGVSEFGASAIFYRLRFWCSPEENAQMKRDILRIIKLELDSNNIVIPYNQLDVHMVNYSKS